MNNEYAVQFKKFVFELGVPINPVAIKYNKVSHSRCSSQADRLTGRRHQVLKGVPS